MMLRIGTKLNNKDWGDRTEWQWGMVIETPPWRFGKVPHIMLYCLRLRLLPPRGEALGREHYDGFMIRWDPLNKFEIIMRRYTVDKKYLAFTIALPISIKYHG